MIRMVPTTKLPNHSNLSDFDPTHSLSAQISPSVIDFDLDYLPNCGSNSVVDSVDYLDLIAVPDFVPYSPADSDFNSLNPPSPSDQACCLSPNLTTDLDFSSVTMFSPGDSKSMINQGQVSSPPCYVPSASPVSLAPSSPYSPACRPARFSSTDSTAASTSSTSTVNLKENLEEFAELQRKIENQHHQPQSPPQIHGVPGASAMISTISHSNSVLKRALEEGSMLHHQNSVSRQNSNNPNGHGQAGGHGVPAMEETKLASVLSMVMCCQNITTVMDDLFEHVRKEIKTQSAMLNINPDPTCWSQADVARWLGHKMQELKIPAASCQPVCQWAANFEGPGFVQITEDEFKARLPQGGDQIYSALDMWRNAAATFTNQDQESQNQLILNNQSVVNNQQQSSHVQTHEELYHVDDVLAMIDNEGHHTHGAYRPMGVAPQSPNQISPQGPVGVHPNRPPPSFEDHMRATAASTSSLSTRMPSIDELLQQQEPVGNPPPPYPGTSTMITLQPPMSHTSSTHDMTEDEADDQDESDPMSPPTGHVSPHVPIVSAHSAVGSVGGNRPAPGPIRGSSSNIHLWQFVKELLNNPQHSGCIHWVDRDQGIFKIVDSVRVAELWGKRKNRPAMNFDKLSRSLRQYYKKGIMKKTSRPQRLVYQFCTPYHL